MHPQIIVTQKSTSDLDLEFSAEALKLPEDQFIALLEDSIKLLQSQLLSVEQS